MTPGAGVRLAALVAGPLMVAGGRAVADRRPWLASGLVALGIASVLWTAAQSPAPPAGWAAGGA